MHQTNKGCALATSLHWPTQGCALATSLHSPTKGCALATSLRSPTVRAGSPTKAQPCVPPISTMHGQPFLIPLSYLWDNNNEKITGLKFCDTLKPHLGQMQNGRHPNNKNNMFEVSVLGFDIFVVFSAEKSIR